MLRVRFVQRQIQRDRTCYRGCAQENICCKREALDAVARVVQVCGADAPGTLYSLLFRARIEREYAERDRPRSERGRNSPREPRRAVLRLVRMRWRLGPGLSL